MLKIPEIPSYYSPATVLFVDDNSAFLSTLALKLNEKLIYRLCNHPLQAIAILKENNSVATPLQKCLKNLVTAEEDTEEDYAFSINLSSLYQEIYNPQRFKNINVVVVDHDMPEMNGFELCQNLKDFPVKKIMLTGVASHAKAVQAFNAGIIDRFIDKGSPELFTLLNTAIAELQEIYYREQSQSLIQTILNQADTCVVNPEFQALFKQLCQQKNIAEFYQLDVTGSFLLLDYEGKITWLFVKSRQEMEDYLDIATENSAPQTIIDALKNKQKLPFFLTPEDYQLPFDQWQPYLHAAQQLGNGEKYYYAVMEGEACYKVFGGRVVSHGGYLGQLCSLATEI